MDQQEDIRVLEAQKEIERILGAIKAEIPIFLYAQPGQNDVFTDTARQAVRFFRQLTDKIVLREFNLYHESAKKWNVEYSPTLVFDPDRYNIRWLGAPLGEEGRIFLEALILIGSSEEQSQRTITPGHKKYRSPQGISRCLSVPAARIVPQQALNALKAAVEKPDLDFSGNHRYSGQPGTCHPIFSPICSPNLCK